MAEVRALLVGINKYSIEAYGGDISLTGAINDIDKAERFLPVATLCRRLTDKQATKQAILDNLGTAAIECVPGDTFHFVFSGHGCKFDTTTGRYTARVAHDAILPDVDVVRALEKFAAGVTVVLWSDCCHADGNSRTADLPPQEGARRKSIPAPRTAADNVPDGKIKQKIRATVYHVSACQSDQSAWETQNGGNFTSAVMLAFRANNRKPVSIKTLFKDVKGFLQGQTPTLVTVNASKAPVPKL